MEAEAIAVDTIGQSDLRGGTNAWLVSATAVAPTVTVTAPVHDPADGSVPITIAPGSPITFSGTSSDDEGLKNVEITLRNNTTDENLASDGTWSVDNQSGWYRISPVDIPGASYNWTYTTPFTLVPGSYSFSVRATDELDLTTSNTNQGRLDDQRPDRR